MPDRGALFEAGGSADDDPIAFAEGAITLWANLLRVAAHNMIGERIWLRVEGQLIVDYRATIAISRILTDCRTLTKVPPGISCPARPSNISCPRDIARRTSSRPSSMRSSTD